VFTPPVRGESFSTQLIRGYHEDAASLRVRYVNNPEIPASFCLTDSYSGAFVALTILTRPCQDFFHIAFGDLVIEDVGRICHWINVVADFPNATQGSLTSPPAPGDLFRFRHL